ncbi:MAG: hypothetical protein JEZ05_08165 [Tenericutes bacterium]|nr:hypothetical protein [Mycoplasmatota bacterium]
MKNREATVSPFSNKSREGENMTIRNLYSKVIILLLFVLVLASSTTVAYSYFDTLEQETGPISVNIGEWMIGISTAQEFYDFATKTDSVSEDKYYLENDIDFSGFTWQLNASNNNVSFKGTLDGNNYTLSNLTIYTDSSVYANIGIFPIINGGTVKNLGLDNVEISLGSNALAATVLAGGLIAGQILNTVTISNITINDSSVRATRGTGAGGIVGYIRGSSSDITITNILATNLKVWNKSSNAGGIVGQINQNVPSINFSNIDIQGDIFSEAAGAYAGGIVGKLEANSFLTISNAVVEMNPQNTLETSIGYLDYANKFIGGLVGYNLGNSTSLIISDTFFTGNLRTDIKTRSIYVGTAIGRNLGTYTMTNSFYSMVQFLQTDGNLYYTPDTNAEGVFSTVVNTSSMPSASWWNNFYTDFDNNLWTQDGTGRLTLIR